MPRDACCWRRRRAKNDPDSPVYTKETPKICRPKREASVAPAPEPKSTDANESKEKENKPTKDIKEPKIIQETKVAEDATKDITGNPRNKCALQPGHSLMDWIRLGQSGRDLTGVGPRAGTLSISPRQLAEHRYVHDAWIAIRGKVYNITAYLPFHPGGVDEIMRGVGKDATALFNEVHAWVNYESILQKCLLGRLTAVEPDVDTEALFYGGADVKKSPVKPKIIPPTTLKVPTTTSGSTPNGSTAPFYASATNTDLDSTPATPITNVCPRFDWIQQLTLITAIFYTTSYGNLQVQVTPPVNQREVDIFLTYDGFVFSNHITFEDNVEWPCKVTINYETGKVEVIFRKCTMKIWRSYGTLKQTCTSELENKDVEKVKYMVKNKIKVNHNTCVLALKRVDDVKQTVPIGKHVWVYGNWNGQEISRSYTPIPTLFMQNLQPDVPFDGDLCLMVKGYPEGMLSPYICSRNAGDVLELSMPLGTFELKTIQKKEGFLLLAAGTGITPMLGILLFILQRRYRRCQRLNLLFFNRSEEDILFREHLEKISKIDNRLSVQHILSDPSDSWQGLRGHVNEEMIKQSIEFQCTDNTLFPVDIFVFVCGPTVFTNLAKSLLTKMNYNQDHIHCFLG